MTEEKQLFRNEREQKIVFFLVSIGVFALTYGLLFIIDFLPEKPMNTENVITLDEGSKNELATTSQEARTVGAVSEVEAAPVVVERNPVKIIFDTLDNREVAVLNPASTAIADLDDALLSGVVRHPESGDFSREGTIFLFGHSSYLPNVFNKNFQAFNGVQNLVWGDIIRLQSADMEYVYRVDRVYQAKASEAEVAIVEGESKLTLATCNSFGSTDDRYVVESTLVDSYPIDR